MKLILGSGSPRRKELLAVMGVVPHDVRPPDIDEDPMPNELPRPYCMRIARQKAEAMAVGPDEIVLCADTTVALGRRILGKPADVSEAEAFLRQLSGRRHKVITAIAVRRADRAWFRDVVSSVRMKRLSEPELAAYIGSEDWRGKAGGYGIQGPAGAFIPWMEGSYPAIMGLPLVETAQLLEAAGYPVWSV